MLRVSETDAPEKILSDAWDYKGRPAAQSRTGGWTSAAMILGVELCERLTTLGIAVNLVTYITGTMHLGNAEAANIVTNFMGASFMLCLLGGFLADTFIGRYLTVAIFTFIQASGVAILTISTIEPGLRPPKHEPATTKQLAVLYLALYTTALGTGGLKSSVSGFGSDQFDESDKEEKEKMTRFFNWFFFFISLGSLLAVTVLVYVQDNIGRQWGYGGCVASVLVGLAIFLSGTRRYRYKKLLGSPLTQIAAVVVAAWRKRRIELPSDPSLLYTMEKSGGIQDENGNWMSKGKRRLHQTTQFRFLDHAAIYVDSAVHSKWQLSIVTDVEEVKIIVRMIPIWATTIMFWTIYAQMTTFCVAQATTMDRRIGPTFEIPPGSLTVFFVGSILLTVPVYDRLIVPISRRLIAENRNGLTPLQRIGIGLLLSVIAMAVAGLVEIKRLDAAMEIGRPPVSVFWLVPQFFLIGSGEAFTYIGQLDFFLRECPKGMKTMSTGLFLSTLSLGFFFSSALVAVVEKVTVRGGRAWLADDLDRGKLYNFYWLLAVLCLVNFGAYSVAARWYTRKDDWAAAAVEDESVAVREFEA